MDMTSNKKTSSITDKPLKAGMREWIGLAVLALPTLLLSIDASVMYLALPHLTADLNPNSIQQLWIMDIYGFMLAGFLITMGTLGDRIGRRRLLMIGASLFGITSVIAAYSNSPEMLIVTRALLGIAGATMMPSTLSLISNMFRDPQQRGMAIGIWSTCFAVGTAIGPAVGGILLEYFKWGSIFLMGVPVMVLLLILGPIFLPKHLGTKVGRLDLVSVVLSLTTVISVIFGIKQLTKSGFQATPIIAIIIGLILGIMFVRRQQTLSTPLFDLRVFKNRVFNAAIVIILFDMLALGGIYYFVTQYLQMVEGLSPLDAGLWMIPIAIAMVVGSMLAPLMARRIQEVYIIVISLVIAACGFLFLTQIDSNSGLVALIVGAIIAFIGISPVNVLLNNVIMGSVPHEQAGSASSLSQTSGELGVALGLALLGSVGTVVYRSQVADSMPADTPAWAIEASEDTFAGAVTAVEKLPDEFIVKLLEPAREAFVAGLNFSSGIASALMIALAILAITIFRRGQPRNNQTGE